MSDHPIFSLIVPTRLRPALLRTFLDSVAATAAAPQSIEVVLVIDSDDPVSTTVACDRLRIRRVRVLPGQTMGLLNTAGYEASTGRFLMLLNDDVIARTPGWDLSFRTCFERWPDEILLLHVNDRIFGSVQCTFPVLSRTFCELAGEICPTAYVRYRIDDHIEDVFNLLGVLGARRTIYLPDVVFEHGNYAIGGDGERCYRCDPALLAADAERFEALLSQRKVLVQRLRGVIEGAAPQPEWPERLDAITDSLALRVQGRLRVLRGTGANLREESATDAWLRALGSRAKRRCSRLGSYFRGIFRSLLVARQLCEGKKKKHR
jgi:hypothetical protein